MGTEYEKTLLDKQKKVKALLGRYINPERIIGAKNPYNYRNKVHAVIGGDNKGNIYAGTYEAGSHRIVPIDSCNIDNEKADGIIKTIAELMKSFKYRPYNEDTGRGFIRHVLIRTAHATGQIMVVLVVGDVVFPSKNNFVKALTKAHPEITTIVMNINNKRTSMVLGDREQVIYGRGYIEDELCGCRFKLSAKSFYQVNSEQTEVLYGLAMKYAHLTGRESVIDAYSGIGTIGIIASKHAKSVVGAELNPDAVRDSIANMKLNGCRNVRYVNEDAGEFMVREASSGKKYDVVFMDPPRAGSDKAFLDSVAKLNVPKLVYISCNPETLARDIEYISKKGYRVTKCTPVDMFPWTEGIETVVLLSQQKADDYIEVELELDELDLTSAESKATYKEIQEYVLKEHGLKVSNLYISQVKRKCGIEVGENYNLPKSEESRQPQCPEEKEKAIKDALEHFGMV